KLWVDDERVPRAGWTWVKTPGAAISLLAAGDVVELSLDHDLGLPEIDGREPTGYDVLLWIEEQVAVGDLAPPRMFVHSANSGARRKMLQAIEAIERLAATREPTER